MHAKLVGAATATTASAALASSLLYELGRNIISLHRLSFAQSVTPERQGLRPLTYWYEVIPEVHVALDARRILPLQYILVKVQKVAFTLLTLRSRHADAIETSTLFLPRSEYDSFRCR